MSKHAPTIKLQATQCKATGLSSLRAAQWTPQFRLCLPACGQSKRTSVGDKHHRNCSRQCVVIEGRLLSSPSPQLPGDL